MEIGSVDGYDGCLLECNIGNYIYSNHANINKLLNMCAARLLPGEFTLEESSLYKELFACGLTNIESFIMYGSNNMEQSTLLTSIDSFLTDYINSLFMYGAGSTIAIDSFFSDYMDLEKMAANNMTVRFVVNVFNKFLSEFITLNANSSYVQSAKKFLIPLQVMAIPCFKANIFKDTSNMRVDGSGVYATIEVSNKLHKEITECIDTNVIKFGAVKLFTTSSYNMERMLGMWLYKCLNGSYVIKYL